MMSEFWRGKSAGWMGGAAAVAGVWLVVAAIGCNDIDSSDPPADTGGSTGCQLDRDCPVGERCSQGECVPLESGKCVDDTDCSQGEECVMEECKAVDVGPTDATDGGDADVLDCAGCVTSMGEEARTCVVGTHNEACGTGGGPCEVCDSDEYCDQGTCKKASCTPESCDGCCKNDECQSGDTDEACGTGAETCETCSGEAFCQDGECTAPCSERCDGCCTEDGECKAGTSTDMCGTGGDMCQSCSEGQECRGGCVETNCEVSCEGCCVDGTCKDGTSDDTCGRNGAACKSCPKSFGCDQRATGGACALQDDSTWDIVAVRGKVPKTRKTNKTFGGTKDEKWDEASKPDVFLKVKNDSASKSGKTSVAKDSLEPSWGETPIKKIAAGDLTGSKKTTLKLVDSDIYDNDHIATCEIQFEAQFDKGQFDGKAHEFVCKQKHAGDEEITTKIWLKLKRNTQG